MSPWRQVWEPAPQDMSIKVWKEDELPENISVIGKKRAITQDGTRWFYYCRFCEGWIEGEPNAYDEDTMGPLCGRRGVASHCKRCGEEINFCGVIS